MIKFPEIAQNEWNIIAKAAEDEAALKKRLAEGTLVERELERLRVRHQATMLFNQELSAEQTPALEMTSMDDYLNASTSVSSPPELIEGVAKDNGTMVMLGPSESGKTSTALQIVHCLLTGTPFLNQQVTHLTGAAGLLSYDMEGSMMLDWMRNMPNLDPKRICMVNAHKRGNPLGVPEYRKQIAEHWRKQSVEVVVMDSFSASFMGHDQNDAGLTMAYYRDLKQFALTEVGARLLIVIVHSTEANPLKARGSTVHKDTADTMLAQSGRRTEPRKLEMAKYRQTFNASGVLSQEMAPVMLSVPDPVTHLVTIDTGAMTLNSLPTPTTGPAAAAAHFPDLPEQHAEAETISSDEEDDEL